jgi:molybdopterin molybdotransferase
MPDPLLPVEAALERLLAAARPPSQTEDVLAMRAAGRVLAHDLVSGIDVPPMDNSAMDGYAVRAADVPAAGARLRIAQRIAAGQVGGPLAAGCAARIFTGAPLPPGADAVAMQEDCRVEGDEVVIGQAMQAGNFVRPRGQDIGQGACILAAGTRLGPAELGLASAVGLPRLPVYRAVRAAYFSTGDELAMPGEPLKPGAIYDANRFMLQALLHGLGMECTDLGRVPDTLEATRARLREAAAGHDFVLSSGGVSVGEEDHVRPAVEAEGRLDLWQIAIKPGKPLAFGALRRPDGSEAHFIGLPGNPVSSFVTFLVLVRPFLLRCQGVQRVAPPSYPMRAHFDWPKPDRRREYLRVRIDAEGGLECFANQGSGVLTSAVWADGLVDNPAQQTIRRGDVVRFMPFAGLLG